MSLRDELLGAIKASGASLPADFHDEMPLISSGLIDSTALFELALWVEAHVAPGLDITAFDLAEEWDTMSRLLGFIERHRTR
jgi:hypothetical protein